nr:MAG TPA: hypothetical protein [Caudoviricetes sp.]
MVNKLPLLYVNIKVHFSNCWKPLKIFKLQHRNEINPSVNV